MNILDNDLYKFSMSYAYMKLYPEAEGKFQFVDRNHTKFDSSFVLNLETALKDYLNNIPQLDLYEQWWCQTYISYIPQCYWEWLRTFKFEPQKITVSLNDQDNLCINVTDKLYKVTLYEVPILAFVSEFYYKYYDIPVNDGIYLNNLKSKIKLAEESNFKFSEFGTRRRFSYHIQDLICEELSKHDCCVGTSNVWFACKYKMKPIGTMAHEWIMFHGAHYGALEANYLALEAWTNVFDGNLGIALTDTYGSNIFVQNFSMKLAKLFDGVRQDSGNEYEFTNKIIDRYQSLNIDPKSKTIVFSNALNFKKAAEISQYCKDKIKCSFGIGTNLTNDYGEVKPMNIVMKLVSCRMNSNQTWKPCVKISDDTDKAIGDTETINYIKHQLSL